MNDIEARLQALNIAIAIYGDQWSKPAGEMADFLISGKRPEVIKPNSKKANKK